MNMFRRFLKVLAAMAVLMAVVTSAPVLADDSSCVMAGLMGEEFGLCNAYCEAMDCDGDNPQASIKACGKVQAKFEAIAFDPVLPCLADQSGTPPTLDLDIGTDGTGATATFVSFGDAIPIAVDVSITDDDSSVIMSAKITLTDPLDGVEETLSLTPTGDSLVIVDLLGTWMYDGTTFTLTITGDGTLAQYEEILKEVIYDNNLDSPDTTASRSIDVLVVDGGGGNSNTAVSVMAVEAGCPCNAFSSPAAVSPGLNIEMYKSIPANIARFDCLEEDELCINGPFAFSCYSTIHTTDENNVRDTFTIRSDDDTRTWSFSAKPPGDATSKSCTFQTETFISGFPRTHSKQTRSISARSQFIWEKQPDFSDEMLEACAIQAPAAIARLVENYTRWQPDIQECAN